jgi:hypothetical protein
MNRNILFASIMEAHVGESALRAMEKGERPAEWLALEY